MENKAYDALSLSYGEWEKLVTEHWKEPRFRADQICQWIYAKKVFDPAGMTNLSKTLREKLACESLLKIPVQIREQKSRDGTRKYLWQMEDGSRVESVLLDHGGHTTACLSSQVGCPLACAFCATGQSGYVRSLSAGEILGQFLLMEQRLGKDIGNVVFMGMGEPLLNRENVFESVRTLNHPKMRNLGARHITLSTSGIAPGIRDVADFEIPLRLSVSLHAPNDTLRNRLMPVNRQYSLTALTDALRYYKKRTGERITIEYVLIDGVNDDPSLAYEMAALLDGLGVYVNLIPWNPISAPGPGLEDVRRSPEPRIKAFCAALTELNIEFEVRREKGTDIMAACGQLAADSKPALR
ncbi:MAG: 23S rRNA (adenine(2503)-C(2))-methyltransferase RlmN [Synergistaceae bacterium]|jgi:23S rRNA (adenine2503-C2)-methyltransferase|nr:23S rRNA (adenine(2503)-C(2))-methyltransferase RlmN [Synergistaceae bacterium]